MGNLFNMIDQEEREQFEREQEMGESFDEKDLWEDGEVCRWCGEPLPEKDEWTCPRCGTTYTREITKPR